MKRRSFNALAAASLATTPWLGACGGGTDRTKAQLRFINASTGYVGLDLLVDEARLFSSVGYAAGDGYAEVDPDEMASSITLPLASTALVSITPSVVKRQYYSLVAFGTVGNLRALLLDDNTAAADNGKTLLRVLNTAQDAGALDVYLTGVSDSLLGATALQASAAVGTLGTFSSVSSGTWRLRVTAAGNKNDVRLDVSNLTLASTDVATLVLTPGGGGTLVNALIVQQQAAITALAATHARVRVAAGLPGSGAVTARVGDTLLMNGVGSPAVGAYALVAAGDTSVEVTADGVVLPTSLVSLTAGYDYTLLVHQVVGAAQLGWLQDDNRLPSASGSAKLRLVHGLADASGALSMTLDGLPVAGAVAVGTASAAQEITAASGQALSVTAVGALLPIFTASDRSFSAGGVYTLFLLGHFSTPVGVLRQER